MTDFSHIQKTGSEFFNKLLSVAPDNSRLAIKINCPFKDIMLDFKNLSYSDEKIEFFNYYDKFTFQTSNISDAKFLISVANKLPEMLLIVAEYEKIFNELFSQYNKKSSYDARLDDVEFYYEQ